MQFTTKLFTAFLALIALMQFVSGATLYSEMKDDTPITVGVSGVALADGCAPQVCFITYFNFLFFSRRTEGRAREKYKISPNKD
jgi:hypothetical protein